MEVTKKFGFKFMLKMIISFFSLFGTTTISVPANPPKIIEHEVQVKKDGEYSIRFSVLKSELLSYEEARKDHQIQGENLEIFVPLLLFEIKNEQGEGIQNSAFLVKELALDYGDSVEFEFDRELRQGSYKVKAVILGNTKKKLNKGYIKIKFSRKEEYKSRMSYIYDRPDGEKFKERDERVRKQGHLSSGIFSNFYHWENFEKDMAFKSLHGESSCKELNKFQCEFEKLYIENAIKKSNFNESAFLTKLQHFFKDLHRRIDDESLLGLPQEIFSKYGFHPSELFSDPVTDFVAFTPNPKSNLNQDFNKIPKKSVYRGLSIYLRDHLSLNLAVVLNKLSLKSSGKISQIANCAKASNLEAQTYFYGLSDRNWIYYPDKIQSCLTPAIALDHLYVYFLLFPKPGIENDLESLKKPENFYLRRIILDFRYPTINSSN
jgi:hypothetical protein